jgi:adenylylsulfate kinase-like enzyme
MAATTLDGDEVRQRLTKGLGFTKEDRDENVSRIAFVATLLTRARAVAITAAISPYRAARQQARREIGAFVEVYVTVGIRF